MEENIIPECYFDTVLVKAILRVKNVNHQKSCYKVESAIKDIDDFAVGIIDKDKKEVEYLEEFAEEISSAFDIVETQSETALFYTVSSGGRTLDPKCT